jgi:hypothetical protein
MCSECTGDHHTATNGGRKATADAQGHFAVTGLSDVKYTDITSDGFQTLNSLQRNGDIKVLQAVGSHHHYRIQGVLRLFGNAPNVRCRGGQEISFR